MPVEAQDPEKLARIQRGAISRFFGTEVPKSPNPGDWLLEAAERIRRENLFPVAPFYLPRRQLAEGMDFPGLRWPLDPWLYEQMRANAVAQDADWLPGEWILLDVTRRPNYDSGKQMYPDTPRFRELLATLRDQGTIAVPDFCQHVPKDSRFAISADEIDGSSSVVAKAVAKVLGLKAKQISIPPCATFNYIGNLAYPELGQVNTSEWFRNNFEHDSRLCGGDSDGGGLADVNYWPSDDRNVSIGFRLQVSSPAKA